MLLISIIVAVRPETYILADSHLALPEFEWYIPRSKELQVRYR